MLPAFSNKRQRELGCRGATALEFALVAAPFIFLMLAGMDLGRYFITEHSLRTLTSEAVRATLIACYASTTPCSLPAATQSTIWSKVPFLDATATGASLSVTWSPPDASASVRTITVTASYPFAFVLPMWTSLFSSAITETTSLQY
jgi:Flp pilus assembly protein TadG